MEKEGLNYVNLKGLFVDKYQQLSQEVKSKKHLHREILIEINQLMNEIKKYVAQ